MKWSNSDDTSSFLKSEKMFNLEHSEWPHKKYYSTFSLGSCLWWHALCPQWEQLKKDACAQKKCLYGHLPLLSHPGALSNLAEIGLT